MGRTLQTSDSRPLRVIDADGHVYEKDVEIFEHLDGPFRGKRTLLGLPFWPSIDGFHRGAIHAHMGLHASFESSAPIWMDFLEKTGIASTVLYPTSGLAHSLIRDPEWAVALARGYNDWMHARYTSASDRIRGVALLPLQDPTAAAAELRRAVLELGAVGGVLPAVGLPRGLGSEWYDPVYAEAERLDVPLAVHGGPTQQLGLDSLEHFAQVHTLGHPFAQMIQITSVLMSGVLDRFPTLRIAFLEAGIGWLPFLAARMDRSFRARKRPEYTGGAARMPSRYFEDGRIYFTVDPGEAGIAQAMELLGEEVLLFASDFPHEVNAEGCTRELAELCEAVPRSAREKLLDRNARRFYRLPGEA
jgi:predicted TIM-barrel fold metal-dependent hydrolase